jgi:hypothetical protein
MDNINLIFLDIDGVVNSEEFIVWTRTTDEGKEFIKNGGHYWVDPKVVKMIMDVCVECDAKIVLSSSWRYYSLEATKEELKRYRDLQPLLTLLVGVTPRLSLDRGIDCTRGEEIQWFLEHMNTYPGSPESRCYDYEYFKLSKRANVKYCIIDDDTDMLESQQAFFVNTDFLTGLTKDDITKVKQIFYEN